MTLAYSYNNIQLTSIAAVHAAHVSFSAGEACNEVQLHLLYMTSCCMVAVMKIDLK